MSLTLIMTNNQNIINFPNPIETKKFRYAKIRDEIEKILFDYALKEKDLWVVALAAGRFASMNLERIDGTEKTLDFFKNCIETERNRNI